MKRPSQDAVEDLMKWENILLGLGAWIRTRCQYHWGEGEVA